jgi:HD superfamily phosphohydrolase
MLPTHRIYDDDAVKTFTIPVSGAVRLYGPEIDVVNTREFQRLAGIRQLGTANLVYRGANHTRYEHSLGTLHRAEQLLQATAANPRADVDIPADAWRLARLAALLHDLPHVPFGHTLEDELRLLKRHDENAARMQALLDDSQIGEALRAALGQDEVNELVAVLAAKDDDAVQALRHPFVADIVGNTVCADALDYTERDLAGCGMPGKLNDFFLDYFTITGDDPSIAREHRRRMALRLDKRGMPRPDVESEVVKLLTMRYELTERVYFHHAKNAASVMIGRAVVDAGLVGGEHDDENFRWLSDEMLLQALARPEIAKALGLRLADRDPASVRRASELGQAVLDRNLHRIAYLAVHDDVAVHAARYWRLYGDPGQRRELEDEIAEMAGLAAGEVLVHVPKPGALVKLAQVRVVTDEGEVLTLQTWDQRHSGRFDALNEAHRRLWRLAVYVSPRVVEQDADTLALVQSAAQDTFRASSRYRTGGIAPSYMTALFDAHAQDLGWTVDDRKALAAMRPLAGRRTRQAAVEALAGFVAARRAAAADGAPGGDQSGGRANAQD